MWIFSETGYLSIVEYSPRPNGPKDPADEVIAALPEYRPATQEQLSSHLLVRARIREDLDALHKYDPEAPIFEDLWADYQFRMIIRRTAVADFLYNQVTSLDYDSHVKETINRRAPQIRGGRMGALMSIWSATSRWQPNPPYGRTYTPSGPTAPGRITAATSMFNTNFHYSTVGTGWVVPKASRGQGEVRSGVDLGDPTDEDRPDDDFDLDIDNPASMLEWWEFAVASGDITRRTMEAQLRDMLAEVGETADVPEVVDILEADHGTIDLESIPFEEVWAAVDRVQHVFDTDTRGKEGG